MATSGSYNFNLTRNRIVQRAFNLINIYGPNDTIDAPDQDLALDTLNMLIKSWQAQIRHSWNRKQATLFTAYQDYDYSLSSSGWHATKSYVSTTISAIEAAAQTVLAITSVSGITANDYIGIELDGGTRQWTTVASVGASTVTVNDALTGAAASGNSVVAYTTKIDRPLELLTANWMRLSSLNETPLEQMLYEEYQTISKKTTDGNPNIFMYDPQLSSGVLYLWPRPNDVDYVINFTFYEAIEDFDSQNDDPDFPQEWILALVYNLAFQLCFPYGRFPEMDKLKMEAGEQKMLALNYDAPNTSVLFAPKNNEGSRI